MNIEQMALLRRMLAEMVASTANSEGARHADSVTRFIEWAPRAWSRTTLDGHITASAWVLDRTRSSAALIHHRKLNRWLQPGGHVEDADVSWRAAAQREVTEETGLERFVPQADDAKLFDVDVHPIPARPGEPAHFHYDLRFLFVADVDAEVNSTLTTNAEEVHDCRWFALRELLNDPSLDASVRRMIELSIRSQ
jgi:8-oxo-dGTP pyrophosphatase MutT (NUDIX family)